MFDIIDHPIYLRKLEPYLINYLTYSWIKCYLNYCKHCLKLNVYKSMLILIRMFMGIAKYYMLGLILFLLL